MGRINNYSNAEAARIYTAGVRKFGSNAGVATSFEDMWEVAAAYTFLNSAATLYIGSTSASDTAVTVTVEGLDANWDVQSVTVDLDATDPQATQVAVVSAGGSETWIRVNRAWVSGATACVGNIYIANEIPATWTAGGVPGTLTNTVAYISLADQQTLQAIYSTPRDITSALKGWVVTNSTTQTGHAKLMIREYGGVFRTHSKINGVANTSIDKSFGVYTKLPGQTDIKIMAQSAASTADFTGEFELFVNF